MGEKENKPFQLSFNGDVNAPVIGKRPPQQQAGGHRIPRGCGGRSHGFPEVLAGSVMAQAETQDDSERVVLDMDSTESPVHGQQEGSAYNGHFESVCYHPLLLQHGDCLFGESLPSMAESLESRNRGPGGSLGSTPPSPTILHLGELFPRVGFIVTNMSLPSRSVVRFYNKRGTAEQWIKEGKQATHWTRLSCHRFRANEVRLQLSVLHKIWFRLVRVRDTLSKC